MAVLVCGGAGYIGSHTVAALLERGEQVVVVDNLSKGHEESLLGKVPLCVGDIRDAAFLDRVFAEHEIDAVIDFAANIEVGESMADPLRFYDNNTASVMTLMGAVMRAKVKYFVFSSTAAVYGEPEYVPIDEQARTRPTNAYGATKLAVEEMLHWCDVAYGIKYTSLRYFNACGTHPNGLIGEDRNPDSHLIPIVIKAALGIRENIEVYGTDYDTSDGTCIRDYIHVCDLADAHILALERMRQGGGSAIYNLGNGQGHSVKQVIDVTREVAQREIPVVFGPRRAGDPAVLVASSGKAQKELHWQPRYAELRTIIQTSWDWYSAHPNGYKI